MKNRQTAAAAAIFIFFLASTLPVFSNAQDHGAVADSTLSRSLSLEECRSLAVENNADVRNAALDVMAARAQKQEALAEYFPKVSVTAFTFYAFNPMLEIGITDILGKSDFSYNLQNVINSLASSYGFDPVYSTLSHGVTAGISVMQPVFAGGRIVSGNRLAALGVEAAGLQQNITRRKTAEDIEKNYWQVVALEEKMKTLGQMQELLDTLYKDVCSACAAGLVTENDILQVKLKQNELRSGKIQLKNGIRLSKMLLFNSIGVEYNPYSTIAADSVPYIDDIVLSDRPEELLPPGHYYRPEEEIAASQDESRLLEIAVQAKKLEKRMALGEALPQIGVGATYGYTDLINDGRMNGAVYAMVQIPISDWGKTSRKVQRYDYQLQKAQNQQEYLNAQLVLQIRKLWLDLESSWEQMNVAEESVRTAEASVRDLKAYYDAGLSPLSELLQAQTQLRQAADDYTEQSIGYAMALQAYLDRCGGSDFDSPKNNGNFVE